jgi:putative transposase
VSEDGAAVRFPQPEVVDDPLAAGLRAGARRLLAQAIEAEAETFLAEMASQRLADGRARLVRHGHGPERAIQTGIGPVEARRVQARDRALAETAKRARFTSQIPPRWARRTTSLEALLPVLGLRGLSTGGFQEALAALLGQEAPSLPPSAIARLKSAWQAEHERWHKRDPSARRCVHVWADGACLQARREPQAGCMLGVIGATPEGRKELVGFQVGTREGARSWRERLLGLKARGLAIAPELAVGDGAPSFWKALEAVFPATRHQRCWAHEAVDVPDKLPRSLQANARRDLREIRLAPDRLTAEAARAPFAAKHAPEHERAVACLAKDREALLAFHGFPAEPWGQLRSSSPIASVLASVRHRTARTKGALSQETARLMVFKLVMAAARLGDG